MLGIRGQISGPKIALLLIAADLATLPNSTPEAVLMLIGAVTASTGMVEIGMGLLRLGSLVRYLPFARAGAFSRGNQLTYRSCAIVHPTAPETCRPEPTP